MKSEFEQPAGFVFGTFNNAKGAAIRYGHLPADGTPKATVVLTPGFREPIEKYFEVCRDLHKQGYDVWMMDWRGQGGSDRYIKGSQRAHHEGYDEQIDTLHTFTQTIVQKTGDAPLIFMGHSMGGHIGLRYLKEHEGVFDSAVLTAPMIDIQTNGLPRPLARQMVKFAKAGKYLDRYIPGGHDWDPSQIFFKNNNCSNDPERFAVQSELFKRDETLRIGDPTYGWVYQTFLSIEILNQESYLKSIKTPVLMQISGDDKVVVRSAQDRAVGLLPNCKRIDVAGAKHEILMEKDNLRTGFLDQVFDFITERTLARTNAPTPKKPSLQKNPKPPR